jgi:hypothetical protein
MLLKELCIVISMEVQLLGCLNVITKLVQRSMSKLAKQANQEINQKVSTHVN